MTMRQLAELAGVSSATVSLALRGDPSISIETRDRIKRLAIENGYRTDAVVASLMTRLRTARVKRVCDKIAILTSWRDRKEQREAKICNHNYIGMLAGIRQRADELGYEIEEFWTKEPGLTAARLSKILYTRGIRGVILAPLGRAVGHLSLNWPYFATATLTYTVRKPDVHRVTHSHYNGIQLALRQLKHRGYKRPGFATMIDQNDRVKGAWLGGYLAYQQTIRRTDRISPLLTSSLTFEEFRTWYEKSKPDVVISNLAAPFRSPLRMLLEMGCKVPVDVGYVSLDQVPSEQEGFKIIAGIDQLAFQQGAATVDLVIKQVQNNEFGLPRFPLTLHLDGVWREGGTVRPPKLTASIS